MDLISAEYGWSDSAILDLTLTRMRQIVAAIQRRQYLKSYASRTSLAWQTRTLAQFIALTVPIGESKTHPLYDLASKIDLGVLGSEEEKESQTENLPSYEKMLAFGQAMERGPTPH